MSCISTKIDVYLDIIVLRFKGSRQLETKWDIVIELTTEAIAYGQKHHK